MTVELQSLTSELGLPWAQRSRTRLSRCDSTGRAPTIPSRNTDTVTVVHPNHGVDDKHSGSWTPVARVDDAQVFQHLMGPHWTPNVDTLRRVILLFGSTAGTPWRAWWHCLFTEDLEPYAVVTWAQPAKHPRATLDAQRCLLREMQEYDCASEEFVRVFQNPWTLEEFTAEVDTTMDTVELTSVLQDQQVHDRDLRAWGYKFAQDEVPLELTYPPELASVFKGDG